MAESVDQAPRLPDQTPHSTDRRRSAVVVAPDSQRAVRLSVDQVVVEDTEHRQVPPEHRDKAMRVDPTDLIPVLDPACSRDAEVAERAQSVRQERISSPELAASVFSTIWMVRSAITVEVVEDLPEITADKRFREALEETAEVVRVELHSVQSAMEQQVRRIVAEAVVQVDSQAVLAEGVDPA
jgi:hypothetical protein